jgi:acyl carrier protein
MEEYKIMTTFEKIQELITEQLDLEAAEVKATTNIREDIDADSLDLFQIINDIEDEFDIEIEDEEKINTVQDLVDYVEANK